MKIEKTESGIKISIWSKHRVYELIYEVRLVAVLNAFAYRREKELIDNLSEKEKPILRKLKLRLFQLENAMKEMETNPDYIDTFELRNKLDFNEWFHNGVRSLINQIEEYSFEFTEKTRFGYCW
ncbi:hypothetical protein EVA_12911 [gut metagenome]|uniref:Uncharacterized protein n=1 Tax=gut metagenome TaxID=749906 RepID=J9CG16_9ZZZZ